MILKDQLRLGMRRLASGVSVVALSNSEGERYAMTASSVTSLSDDPPSLIVCVNKGASLCSQMTVGQRFSVSLLSHHHQALSNVCAQKDLVSQRFDSELWTSDEHSVPSISDAEAIFICEVDEASIDYGTHMIVIGNMISVVASESAANPLLYHDGRYCSISQEH